MAKWYEIREICATGWVYPDELLPSADNDLQFDTLEEAERILTTFEPDSRTRCVVVEVNVEIASRGSAREDQPVRREETR